MGITDEEVCSFCRDAINNDRLPTTVYLCCYTCNYYHEVVKPLMKAKEDK